MVSEYSSSVFWHQYHRQNLKTKFMFLYQHLSASLDPQYSFQKDIVQSSWLASTENILNSSKFCGRVSSCEVLGKCIYATAVVNLGLSFLENGTKINPQHCMTLECK